ncbi:MAG: caspase family protein [Saprospiraceae bacterium]|nr:caspase family protein [Saprospiraceae bacterium]
MMKRITFADICLWLTGAFIFLLPISQLAQKPELVVPIRHNWGILEITFSPDGKYILTGSIDQTARLWDRQGYELQTFKTNYRIYSIAFSPDSKTIVTAGMGNQLTWWSLEGDSLQYKNLSMEVMGGGRYITMLHFSPNGDYLLVATGVNLIVLDRKGEIVSKIQDSHHGRRQFTYPRFLNNGKEVFWNAGRNAGLWDPFSSENPPDAAIRDLTPKDQQGTAVYRNNRAGLASDDKTIVSLSDNRTSISWWNLDGDLIRKQESKWGRLQNLDFSNDGQKILSSTMIPGGIQIWDYKGELISAFPVLGGVESADFSPDGEQVITGNRSGRIDIWDLQGRKVRSMQNRAKKIESASFSPDGRYLVTTAQASALLWDLKLGYCMPISTEINVLDSVFFANDGKSLIVSGTQMTSDEQYELREKIEQSHPNLHPLWQWRKVDYPTGTSFDPLLKEYLAIPEVRRQDSPTLDAFMNTHKQLIDRLDRSRKALQDSLFVAARPITRVSWDLLGNRMDQLPEDLSSINQSSYSDIHLRFDPVGTAKLYRKDEHIATLITVDSADWIVTTPSGLFDASPGAMGLLYYRLLYDGEYEVIELDQLKARYYEPGILQKLLGYAEEAIRSVDKFREVKLYPKVYAEIDKEAGTLNVKLTERNGGIGKVSIFINGKEIVEEANPPSRGEKPTRQSEFSIDLKRYDKYLFQDADSTNTLTVRAYNAEGWLKSEAFDLPYIWSGQLGEETPGKPKEKRTKRLRHPKFYVLSIGTSNYSGEELDLKYGDQDAMMMARAMQSVGANQFINGDSLEVYCLTSTAANAKQFLDSSIEWHLADKDTIASIFRAIEKKAKAEDIILVYLSGHGISHGDENQKQFHYLTMNVATEASISDPETRRNYTIASDTLTKWINKIPAQKQVLIIDACNSGRLIEDMSLATRSMNSEQIRALDRMKDRTGMFILSGSASDKVSYEASQFGQGLLTYSILQGLLTATRQRGGTQYVDVMTLFQHAVDQVPDLAKSIKGIQRPVLGFPSKAASFDIGIVDKNTEIPIGKKKPLLSRPSFLNSEGFLDQDLTDLVVQALIQETEKGKDAEFIFVDVNRYPSMYTLSGFYEQNGDKIEFIKLGLSGPNNKKISLEIPPTTDRKELLQSIIDELRYELPEK